jgi:hypothetical protein
MGIHHENITGADVQGQAVAEGGTGTLGGAFIPQRWLASIGLPHQIN